MTEFCYEMRIFYEDTDAAGVVYYANYLKFMERARSEALRQAGFAQAELAACGFLFVVHSCQMRYLLPAKLDDALNIKTQISQVKRSSIIFAQQAIRKNDLLVSGEFVIACISKDNFKPCAMPSDLANKLKQL